ncbi:MAG TPA: PEP/pyruvate-binding domain-containing protein, partial [Candidatus Sumerlaeota bacterium]|nr:PEP/pyruvate-binding domain-containing protein [Candidatus Sumerlaeota bacterium]
TLHAEEQQAVLGAVLIPPPGTWASSPAFPEYAIQLVRLDPYTREEVRILFNQVRAAIQAHPDYQAYYFPTYEQSAVAEINRAWFESQGVRIGSVARWLNGNVQYSPGWALGVMRYFPGDQVNDAFRQGFLSVGDILLTDGVPADMPMVAGIISLSPSTPNSHIALLAQSYGVPFVYLALDEDRSAVRSLVGRRVVFRSYMAQFLSSSSAIQVFDVQDALSPDLEKEILNLKEPPVLKIAAMAHYGAYSASTDILNPDDIKYFGGKAANFGLLRTSIPNNSPVAAAFSFDLWNAFLSQTLSTGNTLRTEIENRLSGYSGMWPPVDPLALSQTLAGIRNLFLSTSTTTFSPELQAAVLNTLADPRYGFDPNRNIRFRSSTNVEDSEQFIGAGLYDSFSGCLADDLDGDEQGPCLCDSAAPKERGVFRAIRKVYASFYNENAFLERLRYRVPEDDVGMALLVHHSFPDEIELANGVATLIARQGSESRDITLVSQAGAISVTNPRDNSIPEEVNVYYSSFGPSMYFSLIRASNRVVLGDTVLEWELEYKNLASLLVLAGKQFQKVTGRADYMLDFEYKKTAPGNHLEVKQIREVPRPGQTPSITPFLISYPEEFCVFQGEYGNVFSNHRLKSRWRFHLNSCHVTESDLSDLLYSGIRMEYNANGWVGVLDGQPSTWLEAAHSVAWIPDQGTYNVMDGWTMNGLGNKRRYEIHVNNLRAKVSPSESPLYFLRDVWDFTCSVTHEKPVKIWGFDENTGSPGLILTNTEDVLLQSCPVPRPGDVLQVRSYDGARGVSIQVHFYWPAAENMVIKTLPLARWEETTIQGFTTDPIVLRGYYSQTYRPGHHNFSEDFLFEPELEPGLPSSIRRELRAADIRLIHLIHNQYSESQVLTYGFDPQELVLWSLY